MGFIKHFQDDMPDHTSKKETIQTIEAKDLRYGQYYKVDNIIFCHNYLDMDTVVFFHNKEQQIIDVEDGVEGIPLTEEWLLKFGFEKHDDETTYYLSMDNNQYFDYFNVLFTQKKCSVSYEMDEIILSEVEHVNQLQNLYFALTGEELTIKE